MTGWLEKLRGALAPAGATRGDEAVASDEPIALGVLLWSVAEADGRLLDAEKALIGQVLTDERGMAPSDAARVLAAVELAARERIDLYSFAREVADGLPAEARARIVRQLYRVACADGHLDGAETEAVRLVSTLLRVPHDAFIAAKLAAKDEFGVRTPG
jgi:uncharacterized tellurite resistance protein B-like protein